MKAKHLILPLGILLLAGGGFCYWSMFVAEINSDRQIRVSGNIETTEVQIAFKIAGRVGERFFDEGQKVKAGDVVAKLDTADLQCNVALREAEFNVASAAYAALKAGSRPQEIAEAGASTAAAAAEVDRATADFQRLATLFARKTISATEYDTSNAAREIAVQKYNEAKERLSLVREGPRKEQIK